MGKAKPEARYINDGESILETDGRIELSHCRQDPPDDFTDPRQSMMTGIGTKKRVSIERESLVEGGPKWTDGAQTSWYVVYDELEPDEIRLISVQTATEQANLPGGALPLREYANLLAEESPSLSDKLFNFLINEAESHTAHHTNGADKGQRSKLIFKREQLAALAYQDDQIGEGIVIPDPIIRARDPATLVGADGVRW